MGDSETLQQPSREEACAECVARQAREATMLVIPFSRFDNPEEIERRVAALAKPQQRALRTALRYLYETDGPVNLPLARFKLAEPFLDEAERPLTRWLRTRTNGSERKNYGAKALRAARAAKYRCEHCGYADVRALNLDHVDGRTPGTAFACLCACCHSIKSRLNDWTGETRVLAAAEGPTGGAVGDEAPRTGDGD